MTQTIVFSNHKGGVGKTTSTVNIGAGLANYLNKKVLIIDLDPQANLTQSLGVPNHQHHIYGSLTGSYPLTPIVLSPNLHIVPSTLDLSGAEVELNAEPGREYILRELIDDIKANYDYVLIDTPPSLSLLTINAFTAANHIIIPIQAEYLAVQGLAKLVEIIEKIKKRLNKHLELGGLIVTQYDNRKVLHREVADLVKTHFPDKIFKTIIRNNITLAEAPSVQQDIFTYNPKSNGAEDYLNLCKEIDQLLN
ncbi:MAG: ParA family protein [Sphingobacteriales bacterium]|jgi:chromosome partitioning protein|nr:ParA family protein [Sphingobacteriales bacterium]